MTKELEALKRIRQETCPATYMQDFDKTECCDIIERALKRLERYDEILNKYGFGIGNVEIHFRSIEEAFKTNSRLTTWSGKTVIELNERLEMLERYLDKWTELLAMDGFNTKQMVKNDIQFLIKSR